MDTEHQVFVTASPEVEALLADNQTDIIELLNDTGITVRRGFAQDPTMTETGHKEPVSIILATAALIAVLAPTIQKAITALTHRSVLIEEQVLVPVEDSNGKVVRTDDGKPILHWVSRSRFVETVDKSNEETAVTIEGPLNLKVDLRSSSER